MPRVLQPDQHEQLRALQAATAAELTQLVPGILERYPPDAYVRAFDSIQRGGYHIVPTPVRDIWHAISSANPRAGELYHRIVLALLLQQADARRERHRLPASVAELQTQALGRILQGLIEPRPGFYSLDNDLFMKDLAQCRMVLLPCGAELVDIQAALPRSTLFKNGLRQLLQGGVFVSRKLGGFGPLYESHWDRRLARYFSSSGYEDFYRRVAELLALNPSVRGLFSASWWFDPVVSHISPELAFLRQLPEENGGMILRLDSDRRAARDALAMSPHRKALYEAGKYVPTTYMLIWSRGDLLAWANRAPVA